MSCVSSISLFASSFCLLHHPLLFSCITIIGLHCMGSSDGDIVVKCSLLYMYRVQNEAFIPCIL